MFDSSLFSHPNRIKQRRTKKHQTKNRLASFCVDENVNLMRVITMAILYGANIERWLSRTISMEWNWREKKRRKVNKTVCKNGKFILFTKFICHIWLTDILDWIWCYKSHNLVLCAVLRISFEIELSPNKVEANDADFEKQTTNGVTKK